MIVSKPKFNTAFALGTFLFLVFGTFCFLLNSLLTSPDFFVIKLILAPILLVIGLLVMGKFMASLKRVSLGDGKMEVLFLISRMKISMKTDDILGWNEEVIKTKGGEFRELKILYTKKKILKLSNKENTEYDRVVKYLRQKVKVKR
jgi:hypothetical protein